jgi:uncharacterized RDD family membrane protein YckC
MHEVSYCRGRAEETAVAFDYRLETPEIVTLDFEPAGIGSRMLAALIDYLAIAGMEILLVLAAFLIYLTGARVLALVIGLTVGFIIFWGYFILYETVWAGQTPGKRALHIRVIKTTGYPIGFVDATIRNVVRLADFLPSLYGIGLVSMFVSSQARRLGDYAAGTLVVKERSPVRLSDLRVPAPGASGRIRALGEIDPDELNWDMRVLSDRQVAVAREFLRRSSGLQPPVRDRIGGQLASSVASSIGAREPLDAVRFLSRVLEVLDHTAEDLLPRTVDASNARQPDGR